MPNADHLAVFDFCETLADFQTADGFVDHVRRATRSPRMRLRNVLYVLMVKTRATRLLQRLRPGLGSVGKRLKLWQLQGMPEEALEPLALGFYRERIRPHLIGATLDAMRSLQQAGYTVGLSSGGYGIYLKHFVEEYRLDFCHCSELDFRNGRCTGRMAGPDCMRQQKVALLDQAFGKAPAASVAYSDSRSDLPLLQWAARGVVVSHGGPQPWAKQHHFEEITW